MKFDDYQDQAMTTNLRPRVYTEQQVRAMLDYAFNDDFHGQDIDGLIEESLEQHASSLNSIIYPLLGLLEEAGELAGKVKKTIRDDEGVITEEKAGAMILEAGDAQWYISAIADALGHRLSYVAQANLDKLADRAKRGVLRGSGDHR